MGEKKAFELILLGDSISAVEAERLGLVNKVVPEANLDSEAETLARKFLDKSPLSLKLCREIFYQCSSISDFSVRLQMATESGITTWETADGQEGLKSFLEKRKPVWKNQ
jgi:enoyl-CoA hydratase/carnithine racemase